MGRRGYVRDAGCVRGSVKSSAMMCGRAQRGEEADSTRALREGIQKISGSLGAYWR